MSFHLNIRKNTYLQLAKLDVSAVHITCQFPLTQIDKYLMSNALLLGCGRHRNYIVNVFWTLKTKDIHLC